MDIITILKAGGLGAAFLLSALLSAAEFSLNNHKYLLPKFIFIISFKVGMILLSAFSFEQLIEILNT
jgi:hypothetical protein